MLSTKMAEICKDLLFVFTPGVTYAMRLYAIRSLSKDEEHTRLVYIRGGEETTLTLALEYYQAIRDALESCLAGKRWLQEFRAGTVSKVDGGDTHV
mgnify:CR=1 FL=1|jgi:hypothetical protein|nr:MAG TPA: hypothetical protein [Caudoviricetes sp.]